MLELRIFAGSGEDAIEKTARAAEGYFPSLGRLVSLVEEWPDISVGEAAARARPSRSKTIRRRPRLSSLASGDRLSGAGKDTRDASRPKLSMIGFNAP